MAHDIYKEKFYAHRVPGWHELGITGQTLTPPLDVAKLLGIPEVWCELIKTATGIDLPGYKAIMGKDPDGTIQAYSVVSKDYRETSHADFVTLWDRATRSHPIETMGLLAKGSKLFISIPLEPFDVKGVYHLEYLLATNPLNGIEAIKGRRSSVRGGMCQHHSAQ